MKNMKKVSIFIFYTIFLVSFVILQMANVQAGEIVRHGIYKDYNQEKGYPIDKAYNFTILDEKVVSWIDLINMSEGDIIRREYYDPSGRLFEVDEYKIDWSGSGYAIKYYLVPRLYTPGLWKIIIYINGVEKATDTFYISDDPTISKPGNLILYIIVIIPFLIIGLIYKRKILPVVEYSYRAFTNIFKKHEEKNKVTKINSHQVNKPLSKIGEHDVFISHSSKDKAIADAVCAALEASKIRCWIAPRDILPGEKWAGAITKAISGSRITVLIFSKNSNDSEDVLNELLLARDAGIIIIPLKIGDVHPNGDMEYYLKRTHWLDAIDPPTEKQIQKLVETVYGFLKNESLDRVENKTHNSKEA